MQFLTESVPLSGLGGATGVVVCLGYAAGRGWPFALPGQTIAAAAVATVAIGTLAGIYPARRAARLTPPTPSPPPDHSKPAGAARDTSGVVDDPAGSVSSVQPGRAEDGQ
ncbi:ABC transporter permease [Streptomyces brasiliensis]|uniref:Uncharacterized protein n=1 Tax=Streptomyces brasiliensis TaxID=1954 RepID=A0A917LBJ5_9ACTN|nr:ABC transporter permease [Streptomyces brasiliensis]GGJ58647.1 hypothetical protein GCM10010121_081670 [Streptomyces brasiliensis]